MSPRSYMESLSTEEGRVSACVADHTAIPGLNRSHIGLLCDAHRCSRLCDSFNADFPTLPFALPCATWYRRNPPVCNMVALRIILRVCCFLRTLRYFPAFKNGPHCSPLQNTLALLLTLFFFAFGHPTVCLLDTAVRVAIRVLLG